MRLLLLPLVIVLGTANAARAQAPLYFPPLTGTSWATTDPATLGWCPERIDSLYSFLDSRHTKAFLLLKDGRIVLEHYFGTFTIDSLWYWASAGKTLTSTLVGIAQEEGYLDIDTPTDQYLGTGWTSAPPEKEALITVRHQLTMTSGLDDGTGDADCTDPACLEYLADAGTRWAYHNAAYTLLDDVVANATGSTFSGYFNTRLRNRIGMDGLWISLGSAYNNVYVSRARSMARYGLLALNRMVWDQDTILHDTAYFRAATTPSQDLNDSYGYLWWLNGQPSFMLPQVQFVFPGPIMPHAPADMFCGLGKNDQLLNVVPGQGIVLVRMGDPAYTSQSVAAVFNDEIWEHIQVLDCTTTGIANTAPAPSLLTYDAAMDRLHLQLPTSATGWRIAVLDACGRSAGSFSGTPSVDTSTLPPGVYTVTCTNGQEQQVARFAKGANGW